MLSSNLLDLRFRALSFNAGHLILQNHASNFQNNQTTAGADLLVTMDVRCNVLASYRVVEEEVWVAGLIS